MRNPRRDQMIEEAIAAHPGEPITVESLAQYFEPDFDLGDDDLEPYRVAEPARAATEIEFEGGPEAKPEAIPYPAGTLDGKPQAPAPAPVTPEPEALPPQARAVAAAKAKTDLQAMVRDVAEPEAPPATPEAIERATARRLAADHALANARVAVIGAQNTERDARGKLAKAVSAFQSGFPPITREQLMRDMIASEQARKAAGHTSHPQSRPGKSVVDRVAFYGRGGNPARGDYRRGAFPSQAFGAPNHDPRRGAVAAQPKVPSER